MAGAAGPKPPRPATLRGRPFLFISSFLIFHQAVATTSLFPIYSFFSSNDASTAFLAGPTAAFVLRQKAPWPLSRKDEDRTLADVVEDGIRGGLRGGFGLFRKWRESKSAVTVASNSAQTNAEDAESNASVGRRAHDTLRRALGRARGPSNAANTESADTRLAHSAVEGLEGRQDWKYRLGDAASAVRMKHVMDFAAAYLVVKVRVFLLSCHFLILRLTSYVKALLPIRVGLSLYFGPRMARMFARRWP
jgi:hypothetical protein